MNNSVYNFSAGPAALPLPVMQQIKDEWMNYQQSGMSIVSISHRSSYFSEIMSQTRSLLAELLSIPEDYEILFTAGGATAHFSLVPLNIGTKYQRALYIDTGAWSYKAIKEAKKVVQTEVIASSRAQHYTTLPHCQVVTEMEADYLHITTNNTIFGTQYQSLPTANIPLVADMTSDILSKHYDISNFGIVYAGCQKNLGIAGLSIVIIKKELLQRAESCPYSIGNYQILATHQSLYNTVPTFAIYTMLRVLEWTKAQGGTQQLAVINKEKARLLYEYIDNSKLFSNVVDKQFRSKMNIPFSTGAELLDAQFITAANQVGLLQLKGHRSTGGMRASIYNAMPIEGVQALVEFMENFELNHFK